MIKLEELVGKRVAVLTDIDYEEWTEGTLTSVTDTTVVIEPAGATFIASIPRKYILDASVKE